MNDHLRPCVWPDCGRLHNDESGLCSEHRQPASALTPRAEFAVQRVERNLQRMRESGDTFYAGQIHRDLALACDAQQSAGSELVDDPAGGLSYGG